MGTTLDERPADRERQLKMHKKVTLFNYLNSCTYLTCTDPHYKSGHNDDLIGLSNLADSHHHSRDDGEDVVEEEGALPVAGSMRLKILDREGYVFYCER